MATSCPHPYPSDTEQHEHPTDNVNNEMQGPSGFWSWSFIISVWLKLQYVVVVDGGLLQRLNQTGNVPQN